jgi:hypothetical protein
MALRDAAGWLAAALATAGLARPAVTPPSPVDVLSPIASLPTRLVATFQTPQAFAETTTGEQLVLDAGAHALYAVDPTRTRSRRIVQVGAEPGRILQPHAFALGPNDIVAIADSPGPFDRVQYFGSDGLYINGFYVPNRGGTRLSVGSVVLNGIGSLQFTGRTFLFNTPESGALITEVGLDGVPLRTIGLPRATGQPENPALDAVLNVGMPLVDPTGGFYFVFQTGVPMFRKYDASGRLLFERHIEGIELDDAVGALPTVWPARPEAEGVRPFAPSLVRTASVDRSGRLWVALTVPYTYVYDGQGDKVRTVQFQGTGVLTPTSLYFAKGDRVLVTPGCYEFSSR